MRTPIIALALLLSACGISDGKEITSLSDSQAESLCEEYEPRTITCSGDGFDFEIVLNEDCESNTSATPVDCTATVGDYRSCMDALYERTDAEVCEDPAAVPGECSALFDQSCVVAEQE